MPDEIDLNCWVFGDKPPRKCIFPLRVSRNQTVHYLRKAIKDEKKPTLMTLPLTLSTSGRCPCLSTKNVDNHLSTFVVLLDGLRRCSGSLCNAFRTDCSYKTTIRNKSQGAEL